LYAVDDILYHLNDTSGNAHILDEESPFYKTLNTLRDYIDLTVINSNYVNEFGKHTLKRKNSGCLVLLIKASQAINVLMGGTDRTKPQNFTWTKVGELHQTVYEKLNKIWPETNGIPVVLQATLRTSLKEASLPVLTLKTEEYPFIKIRDVDYLFSEFKNLNQKEKT
jgi:hypothetical protein